MECKKILISSALSLFLLGCGGGGDDSPQPNWISDFSMNPYGTVQFENGLLFLDGAKYVPNRIDIDVPMTPDNANSFRIARYTSSGELSSYRFEWTDTYNTGAERKYVGVPNYGNPSYSADFNQAYRSDVKSMRLLTKSPVEFTSLDYNDESVLNCVLENEGDITAYCEYYGQFYDITQMPSLPKHDSLEHFPDGAVEAEQFILDYILSRSPILDDAPTPFKFTPVVNADMSSVYSSNIVNIEGINTEVLASIDSGTLIKNGIELSGTSTTVVDGDTLRIKLTSSLDFGTTIAATLNIGGQSETYSITTLSSFFKDIPNGEKSTYYTSNEFVIQNDNTVVSIDTGTLIINGIEKSSLIEEINKGDSVQIKLLSSATLLEIATSNISLDQINDKFTITTKPDNYDFISNTTYSKIDTTFYYLTMQNDANIDFTRNNPHSVVTIYDTEMNQLHEIISTQIQNLSAGSYIVKIQNPYSSDSVTIFGILH